MKICVIGLNNAIPKIIFQDERLANLRRLMDAGLYGTVMSESSATNVSAWKRVTTSHDASAGQTQSVADVFAANGKKPVVEGFADWDAAYAGLAAQDWDYFEFVDSGLEFGLAGARPESEHSTGSVAPDYHLWLDEQIGRVMETLDDQTILLVVSVSGPKAKGSQTSEPGMFLLAAPNCPLAGEHVGASLLDLAPTLLDLSGYEIPASMQGRSLVAGMEKRAPAEEDHEKIIYDRLAGLGYV